MKKFVLVGCGSRGVNGYAIPLVKEYGEYATLSGVYDINRKRAELVSDYTGKDIPVFDDFDKMLDEIKPDSVIVTTKDADHDYYIVKAMEKGCDVVSEKPVTTTFEKALNIKKAKEKYGKDIIVTFNLRHHPLFLKAKELIKNGEIGEVLSVHYEWMLNTSHGADYFRRWHRERKNSGSLLIHKSTHHFDIVNWLLEDDPVYVNAFGKRGFYGHTREERSERCLTCEYKDKCSFFKDITKDADLKKMYLDCEDADGYFRDKCVFSDEIDIEDTVSVNVEYSKGTVMSYSLNAHSPFEGACLILNGTLGRMEIRHNSKSMEGYNESSIDNITIYKRDKKKIYMDIDTSSTEGHGGADTKIRNMLFIGKEDDPLGCMADFRAGIMSASIGMASNLSMKEGRRVYIGEFFDEVKKG